ncbi:MAG: hypothetical protein JW760_09945 [Spirochaetales bacterium]|nr:hypothetical protein [Spirochaetales bacterium]
MVNGKYKRVLGFVVLLGLFGTSAAGLPGRSGMPVPPAGAVVVTVGPERCDFTTIREALGAVPPGSVLELAGGIFTEGNLLVAKDIFIRGSADQETVIQAKESLQVSTERVLWIAEGVTAVLSDLTLRHGRPSGECPRSGGGLINYGTLWMERCVISDNAGQCGGGIENREGFLYAFDCMILRNEAAGGVTEDNDMSMGSGGGIKNTRGELYLENCTLAHNKARKRGGAVKNCCQASLTMRNCTVAHNISASGALHSKGALYIDHCTFAFNRAPNSYAAGIFLASSAVVRNTIVAGNTLGDMLVELEHPDAEVRVENLWLGIDPAALATFSGDPRLGPLQDNGGYTWTCLLLPGSPAVDAGSPSDGSPPLDQRGFPRPAGKAPDLGAVEMNPEDAKDL